MRRRVEAKRHRIADVQISNALARRLNLLRFRDDIPDRISKLLETRSRRNY